MSAGEIILTHGLVKMEFNLVQNQTRRMGSAGASVIGKLGPSIWQLAVQTIRLNMTQARAWSAWIDRRKEHGHSFTAWRLFRVNPLGALGTPDGSTTIAINPSTSQIQLNGVGAAQVRIGDMISWRNANDGYECVQAQEDADAVAGLVTFAVTPRPISVHATTPAVRRVQALAEFELTTDPGTFEDYGGRSLSFEALQLLR